MNRCGWEKTELEILYHDTEWCRKCHDDRKIFEFLVLEMMQAGLSWKTILEKRENMRSAFDAFDFEKIARYNESDYFRLLNNEGIIRNKRKLTAMVSNAQCFIKVREEFGSFDSFIWSFVDGKQIVNNWDTIADIPASTELSDRVSNELKKRGFKFVGTVICYSFLQAIGIVNDHIKECSFRFSN